MIYMNCSRNFKLVLILSSVALCLNTVQAFFLSSSDVYAQENVNPLVYHLSSDEPWRATVAISDATTLLKLGHNVTLLLSVEGVQIGVKNPHHYLGLNSLTGNVTDFISEGGNVIICEVCLKIAGYNNSDIIDGALIGNPEIMSKLLSNATVIDY
jgi:predicted peroxiredoxin